MGERVQDPKISKETRVSGLAYLRSLASKGVKAVDLDKLYKRPPSFWGAPSIGNAVPLFDAAAHKERAADKDFFEP